VSERRGALRRCRRYQERKFRQDRGKREEREDVRSPVLVEGSYESSGTAPETCAVKTSGASSYS
jgi:hypothetical protein